MLHSANEIKAAQENLQQNSVNAGKNSSASPTKSSLNHNKNKTRHSKTVVTSPLP